MFQIRAFLAGPGRVSCWFRASVVTRLRLFNPPARPVVRPLRSIPIRASALRVATGFPHPNPPTPERRTAYANHPYSNATRDPAVVTPPAAPDAALPPVYSDNCRVVCVRASQKVGECANRLTYFSLCTKVGECHVSRLASGALRSSGAAVLLSDRRTPAWSRPPR